MKGLLRAWLAAKLLPVAIRLATWAAWLVAIVAYGGYVALRVRRLAKRGVLDDRRPGDPPSSVSAKERGVAAWIRGDEPLGMGPGLDGGDHGAPGRADSSIAQDPAEASSVDGPR